MGTDSASSAQMDVSGFDHKDWERIEGLDAFRALVASKIRFVVPAVIFFLVYYFALPVLVGYFPAFMETKVIGDINLAYLFALSEFVMAWAVMYFYVREARIFDGMAAKIVATVASWKGGSGS
ncbi:MAG: DUF485 domain-containing protein [Acidobacteriaceae bacterium]|nr:DUF485 domain-containing protein [Acidobacteriaceae bacterium]